jgi:hypothetical protein
MEMYYIKLLLINKPNLALSIRPSMGNLSKFGGQLSFCLQVKRLTKLLNKINYNKLLLYI